MDACSNVSFLRVVYFIKQLLNIAFILIPIALILIITIDFAKNVMSDERTMKDNLKITIKRLIYSVAIFLVPFIVRFTMDNFVESDVGYMKCYNVDLDAIDAQIKLNKDACESNGEWDPIANECIIDSTIPDRLTGDAINYNSSSYNFVNASIRGSVDALSINGENLKSYSKFKNLGEIVLDNPINVKPVVSKVGIAQGFCVAGKYYVAMLNSEDDTRNTISLYNKKGKRIKSYNFKNSTFGHANGMTYNSAKNEIYVAMGGGRFRNGKYKYFTADFNKSKFSPSSGKYGGKKIQSIAYDPVTKYTYFIDSCGPSGGVYAWDSSSKKKQPIKNRIRENKQDIAAYNGLVYAIYYNEKQRYDVSDKNAKKARNALDIYRSSDGKYLGSYIVKTKNIRIPKAEFESIDYSGSGNTFVFYFNEKDTSRRSYIYTAEINLN